MAPSAADFADGGRTYHFKRYEIPALCFSRPIRTNGTASSAAAYNSSFPLTLHRPSRSSVPHVWRSCAAWGGPSPERASPEFRNPEDTGRRAAAHWTPQDLQPGNRAVFSPGSPSACRTLNVRSSAPHEGPSPTRSVPSIEPVAINWRSTPAAVRFARLWAAVLPRAETSQLAITSQGLALNIPTGSGRRGSRESEARTTRSRTW